MIPPRLKAGDEIRVITPARTFAMIRKEQRESSLRRFSELGLKVTFGKHLEESDEFHSSSIESRVADLHDAFRDPSVRGIVTVIGGFNSNQLLRHLDYALIRANPKILCGYSDITALQNAILAKTGLVTYSGPHFSTFAMEKRFDFTMEHFKKCLLSSEPFELRAGEVWSDDAWYMDQEKRDFVANPGYLAIQEGEAEGTIVGGNLCTFQLLHGTEYLPSLRDSILFIEEDELSGAFTDVCFDRDLQSILHQPGADGIRAVVIGRFQKASQVTEAKICKIVADKRELRGVPVVAGVDFGHTDPYITFPVGGRARVSVRGGQARIEILKH